MSQLLVTTSTDLLACTPNLSSCLQNDGKGGLLWALNPAPSNLPKKFPLLKPSYNFNFSLTPTSSPSSKHLNILKFPFIEISFDYTGPFGYSPLLFLRAKILKKVMFIHSPLTPTPVSILPKMVLQYLFFFLKRFYLTERSRFYLFDRVQAGGGTKGEGEAGT